MGDHRGAAETALAAEVKRLLACGQREEAAERFGAIIDRLQRRAARKLRGLLDRDGWTARGRTAPDRTARTSSPSRHRFAI